MQQSDEKSKKTDITSCMIFACFFIVLFKFTSSVFFLAFAFLFSGVGLYKALTKDPQRTVALVVCITLALGVIAYQVGKGAAIRDNATSAAQTANQ